MFNADEGSDISGVDEADVVPIEVVTEKSLDKSKEAEVTDAGVDAGVGGVDEADALTIEGDDQHDEADGLVQVSHDEDETNLYPNMERHGNIFLIPGINRDIVVKPHQDKCSMCKPKNRENWCRHLVAAGKKLSIFVTPNKDGTKGLQTVMRYMRDRSSNTGRKKPRKNDYKDNEARQVPARAPYRFKKNMAEQVPETDNEIESVIASEVPPQSTVEEQSSRESADISDEPKKTTKKGKRGENRCEDCDGCRRQEDCKECINCKDKRGNGGPGVLRQCCKLKKCIVTKNRTASRKTKLPAVISGTPLSDTAATISGSTSKSASPLVSSASDVTLSSAPSAPTRSDPSAASVSSPPSKTLSPPRKRIKRAVLVSPPPLRSSRRRPALPTFID